MVKKISQVPRKKKSFSLSKLTFAVWGLCVIVFVITLTIATNFGRGIVQDTKFGNSNFFLAILSISVCLGILSFGIGILTFIFKELLNKSVLKPKDKSLKSILSISIKFLLIIAVFPLFLVCRIINPAEIFKKIKRKGIKTLSIKTFISRKTITKFVAVLSVSITLIPIWFAGYAFVGFLVKEELNLVEDSIALAGTGSMYPTFPKGQGKTREEQTKEVVGTPGMQRYPSGFILFDKRFLGYEISKGDIISFENEKTYEITTMDNGDPAGFIKRVLALPGDIVEIRGGILYINGERQKEPWIARAQSTFGGEFLRECKTFTIPERKLFVLGDNRKASMDSRHELGLIDYEDIGHVIPLKKQIGNLDKNWRDTANDFEELSKIRIDKEKYLELLNEKRKEAGVPILKYEPKLEKAAAKRGEIILEYDDVSYEATKSGYPIKKAMREVSYYNTTWGEAPLYGYYDAEELIETLFEWPDWKEFLTDENYDDFGIAEVEGEINSCPTQIIVQHFGGYIPPNYTSQEIEGWKTTLRRLKEIQPSWEKLKTWSRFYEENKKDIDRITEIISIRIANIEGVVAKMENNQWLSQTQIDYTYQDTDLYNEQESIATKLNNKF